MENYFIDWLSISQIYPAGGLPVIADKIVTITDKETGEIIRETPTMKSVDGSYSSKLRIRCDGQRVSVEGNPSRFCRPDNLYGLTKIEDCVQIYNQILSHLGIPVFTKCKSMNWYQGKDKHAAYRSSDGALISRIDWTINYAVGKGNESATLRGLSTYTIGRGKLPNLYANQNTLDWGSGSEYWYQKIYNKAHEIKLHSLNKSIPNEEKKYIERLISHCESMGIIRHEKEFKRKFLQKKNLCFYGQVKEIQFKPYLNDLEIILRRVEMTTSDYETISDQLLDNGIVNSRQAANSTQSYALAWLHGQKLHIKKSQYYEHLRRLRLIGIDIAVPFDCSKKIPQIKRERAIQLKVAQPPSWYLKPTILDKAENRLPC